jgi:hypothetical protein
MQVEMMRGSVWFPRASVKPGNPENREAGLPPGLSLLLGWVGVEKITRKPLLPRPPNASSPETASAQQGETSREECLHDKA